MTRTDFFLAQNVHSRSLYLRCYFSARVTDTSVALHQQRLTGRLWTTVAVKWTNESGWLLIRVNKLSTCWPIKVQTTQKLSVFWFEWKDYNFSVYLQFFEETSQKPNGTLQTWNIKIMDSVLDLHSGARVCVCVVLLHIILIMLLETSRYKSMLNPNRFVVELLINMIF